MLSQDRRHRIANEIEDRLCVEEGITASEKPHAKGLVESVRSSIAMVEGLFHTIRNSPDLVRSANAFERKYRVFVMDLGDLTIDRQEAVARAVVRWVCEVRARCGFRPDALEKAPRGYWVGPLKGNVIRDDSRKPPSLTIVIEPSGDIESGEKR